MHRTRKYSDINVGQRRKTSALGKGRSRNQKRNLDIHFSGCAKLDTRTHAQLHTQQTTDKRGGEGERGFEETHNENGKGTAGSLT